MLLLCLVLPYIAGREAGNTLPADQMLYDTQAVIDNNNETPTRDDTIPDCQLSAITGHRCRLEAVARQQFPSNCSNVRVDRNCIFLW